MQIPLDHKDVVQVQSEAENCRETTRSSTKGWHWNRIYPRGEFTPHQIIYTGEEKILKQLPIIPRVEDFFRLYIMEEITDHVVTQTNLYARQYLEAEKENLRPHSTNHQWKPSDRAEMLTFLGLPILMGIVHKPRLTMYWSKNNIVVTPIFNQMMKRDRFLLLLRFLHFADDLQYNAADPKRDKLYKLREVVEYDEGHLWKGVSLTTERISVMLMQKYLDKGHHLFMDNLYTSLPLAEYLLKHDTHVMDQTGTTESIFQPH